MVSVSVECKRCGINNLARVRTKESDMRDVEPVILEKIDDNIYICEIDVKCDKCRMISRYKKDIKF